jgi:hypothetical protein
VSGQPSPLMVDGHVHFHACYEPARFFEGAARRFGRAAAELGLPADTPGCLCFTEAAGDQFFRAFAGGRLEPGGGWSIAATSEPESLLARRGEDGRSVFLLAGRQIVTKEGLEVLALGTRDDFPERRSTLETLAAVRRAGAQPGIPWGFGKWWLGRGALVRRIVESAQPGELFLGDNGGRPRRAREHPIFALARDRGIPVLPGSDPLPFARANASAGRTGFLLRGFDPEKPAASVLARVRELAGSPPRFGRGEGLPAFCRDQIAMQLHARGLWGRA